jgi:2-amino-4-hydroxy-6-hydroxymethyldihydropteridine diphosphokinase
MHYLKNNEDMNCYLSLGSNIGDKVEQVTNAIDKLNSTRNISVSKISSYYVTRAYGYTKQPDFVNAVIEIKTSLSAHQLLSICKQLEKLSDRIPSFRWGPRTLDIDIILYGNYAVCDDTLTIPHREFLFRDFVIYPLLEISPNISLPGGILVKDNAKIKEDTIIKKIVTKNRWRENVF